MARFAVILPAAGKSSRFKDKHYKKPFAPLANRAVWLHSAEKFLNRDDVKQLIVVISAEDREDLTAHADTVVIEPDLERITMTWRVARPLQRNMFEIAQVLVGRKGRQWWQQWEKPAFPLPVVVEPAESAAGGDE